MAATHSAVSGNMRRGLVLQCYSGRLVFLQPLEPEFEMGNYCFSCSFFLSLRDGSNTLTHSHCGNYPAVSFISHSGPKVQSADSSLANIQLSNRPEMVTKMKGALMRLEEWPQSMELVARAVLTRVDPIGFFLYCDPGERAFAAGV